MNSLEANRAIVRSLAKLYRGRTQKCNWHDSNVCKTSVLPTTPWLTQWLPGDLFSLEVKFRLETHQFSISANDKFICMVLRIPNVMSSLFFSVNRPDVINVVKTPLCRLRYIDLPVFVASNSVHAVIIQWLKFASTLNYIAALNLGKHDSFHVYGNQLKAYLKHPSQSRIEETVQIFHGLAGTLPLVLEETVDFTTLPEELRKLTPLLKKWAVTDDAERDLLVTRASKQSLRKMVDTVYPLIKEINQYLRSFGDKSLSEAACLLGTLAECATEAKLRLKRSE